MKNTGFLAVGATNVCELLAAGNLYFISNTIEINDMGIFSNTSLDFKFLSNFNFAHKFYMAECGLNFCMWSCNASFKML